MAKTTVPTYLSAHQSIIDSGDATAITIDSSENISIGGQTNHDGAAVLIAHGDSGVTTYSDNADELVIENNGNAGISILTPNNATGSIIFGDSDDDDIGKIVYNHADNSLTLTATTTATSGNTTVGGTLGVTGAVTANAGVVVDNITIDGTEIDLSSGDLTVDVAGEIHLDADGGIVRIRDAGGDYGMFQISSSDFIVRSMVQDKDLLFKGNDGGSVITALTLDMSEAGAATFNSSVSAPSGFINGANGGIRIHTGGTKFFNITAANAARDNHMDIGASDARFKDLHIGGSIVNSGSITLDTAGRIDLSADDNGEIRLFDGSSMYGQFKDDDDRFKIQALIQDKDIMFAGNDGGSEITALTLDMSDAGTATFNHDIILGDNGVIGLGAGNDLQIWHDGSNSHISNNYGAFYIDQHQNDGNLILRCDDMSGGLHDYFYLDGGTGSIKGKAIRDIEWTTTATNSTAGHHIFKSYNTEIMRIDGANNRVGIGTASPSRNLTVSSSGQTDLAIIAGTSASAQLQFGDSGDDNIGQIEYNNSDNSMAFYANASEAMMIHSAGNVSIGNTAADNGILSITAEKNSAGSLWSQVGPNNNASLIIQNSSSTDNTNACLYFANDAGVSAAINARFVDHSDDETELRFSTHNGSAGAERMVLSGTGCLGIGTMSPTAAGLHISMGNPNTNGDAHLLINKTGNNDWTSVMGGGADDYGLLMRMVGDYALAVYHHGDSNYEFRVDTNGAIYATDTSVNSISDRRLKENIVDAKSQWDDIKALKWRNFNWNEASGRSRKNTLLGLIADEVEAVSPKLVGIDAQPKEDKEAGKTDPEYKNVKYSIVWMKAMKALQEAQERIETLEAKVKTLEDG